MTRRKLEPWRVLDSTEVFAAPPFLAVHAQRVGLPDGRAVGPYHRVVMPDYALIFAETDDKKLLVLRQYKHGVGAVSLTFPAGTLNPGEAAADTARRELLEETGYAARTWRALGSYTTHANSRVNIAHLFVAEGCHKVAEPDSGDLEEMELLLMTRAELFDAARRGEIMLLSQLGLLALATHPVLAEALGGRR